MTEPGPCCWCSGVTDAVRVESKPFLGRTLWRVKCYSYPCQLVTYTAYGWSRETAVARYNRRREKELAKRWKYENTVREMTDEKIYELLVIMEMRYQQLGANLVHFMDEGFDPDAYYTPCENAMYRVYETLGYDRHDIVREAYRRLKEDTT